MTNIVLCGGSGTRLWPISRTTMPKQFVKLFNKKSLFQHTIERNSLVCDTQFIVSNTEQYFLVVDQLEEIKKTNNKYLLEPVGRNTAPAIALACIQLDPNEIVLITPSDHLIKNETEYHKLLMRAQELASKNNIVTFGITPSCAETGFGYIEANGLEVRAFHEKPDQETAQKYVKSGNYYWNSGIFCFKAGVFLDELKKYSPKIYQMSQLALKNTTDVNLIRIKHIDMIKIPSDSIDYAVMEKSSIVKVIPSNIGWSDLGNFESLFEELPTDKDNNTIIDQHIAIDSKNNFIYAANKQLVTIDVEDLIIVDMGDALLVSKKGNSQKVKQAVAELKKTTQLHNTHLTTHRPWGSYTILEDTQGYKIKRIEVKPGKRLSLQKHFHRSEHWIVVSGTATVNVGEETELIRPNESTYINIGELHRLSNEGKIPVILIEAQVGEYTGEDDIIRVRDDFDRK